MSDSDESTVSSMLDNSSDTKFKKLFAAVRFLDDESKKIVAIPVRNVRKLDTTNPRINVLYYVYRNGTEIPAQLFQIANTEEEALKDDGQRKVFKKLRVSAAGIAITKENKKAAAAKAKEKKNKAIASKDKQLASEIMAKKDKSMHIDEKRVDKVEAASITKPVKPPELSSKKIDDRILSKRYSVLKQGNLDFCMDNKLMKQDNNAKSLRRVYNCMGRDVWVDFKIYS